MWRYSSEAVHKVYDCIWYNIYTFLESYLGSLLVVRTEIAECMRRPERPSTDRDDHARPDISSRKTVETPKVPDSVWFPPRKATICSLFMGVAE